mmetsp:Transcript_174734/g.560447  ORF Transcript_174734/g.560447 Transcript_174734/m.560447 type:complete len:348 (+) Transcript_174734:116-1159(+)
MRSAWRSRSKHASSSNFRTTLVRSTSRSMEPSRAASPAPASASAAAAASPTPPPEARFVEAEVEAFWSWRWRVWTSALSAPNVPCRSASCALLGAATNAAAAAAGQGAVAAAAATCAGARERPRRLTATSESQPAAPPCDGEPSACSIGLRSRAQAESEGAPDPAADGVEDPAPLLPPARPSAEASSCPRRSAKSTPRPPTSPQRGRGDGDGGAAAAKDGTCGAVGLARAKPRSAPSTASPRWKPREARRGRLGGCSSSLGPSCAGLRVRPPPGLILAKSATVLNLEKSLSSPAARRCRVDGAGSKPGNRLGRSSPSSELEARSEAPNLDSGRCGDGELKPAKRLSV